MHLTEAELQTYYDHEVNEQARLRIEEHLDACQACQELSGALARRAESIQRSFHALDPGPAEVASPLPIAQARFKTRLSKEKEKLSMWQKLNLSRTRPVVLIALLALVLLAAFAFPQVRAVANNFLGLFRVEQVAVVEINPANLPEELGKSATFEELLAENVEVEEFGEHRRVSGIGEARSLTGVDVRLPSAVEGEPQIWAQKGARVTFTVDLERTRFILNEIGRTDVQLPDQIDGATAVLSIPESVLIGYGECDFEGVAVEEAGQVPEQQENCTVLAQTPSPTISAPPGLNLAELGQSFLQLMGMTPEEAEKFSQTVDWTTTLILPIPRYHVEYKYVDVDGVTGTLIQERLSRPNPNYMLVWVKNDVVYVLTGRGNGEQRGIAIANSLN